MCLVANTTSTLPTLLPLLRPHGQSLFTSLPMLLSPAVSLPRLKTEIDILLDRQERMSAEFVELSYRDEHVAVILPRLCFGPRLNCWLIPPASKGGHILPTGATASLSPLWRGWYTALVCGAPRLFRDRRRVRCPYRRTWGSLGLALGLNIQPTAMLAAMSNVTSTLIPCWTVYSNPLEEASYESRHIMAGVRQAI